MEQKRNCAWLSGPKEAGLKVTAAQWWLAISRDVLVNDYRRRAARIRPTVSCHRVPTFASPVQK